MSMILLALVSLRTVTLPSETIRLNAACLTALSALDTATARVVPGLALIIILLSSKCSVRDHFSHLPYTLFQLELL